MFVIGEIVGRQQESARAARQITQHQRRKTAAAAVGQRILCKAVRKVQRAARIDIRKRRDFVLHAAPSHIQLVRAHGPAHRVLNLIRSLPWIRRQESRAAIQSLNALLIRRRRRNNSGKPRRKRRQINAVDAERCRGIAANVRLRAQRIRP